MQFNDTTNLNGLIQEAERLTGLGSTGISGNTTLLKDFTSRMNQALDRYVYLAFLSDGKWQFDDTNNAAAPTDVSLAVNSGQQNYAIPTTALALDKLLIKDSSGVWHELTQVDHMDKEAKNIWELPSGNNGLPTKFDLYGNFIYLDPIPNYTQSASLKILNLRAANKFSYDSTTLTPGIPVLFHNYLPRYAASIYAIEHGLSTKGDLFGLVQADELAIQNYYASREAISRRALVPNVESAR